MNSRQSFRCLHSDVAKVCYRGLTGCYFHRLHWQWFRIVVRGWLLLWERLAWESLHKELQPIFRETKKHSNQIDRKSLVESANTTHHLLRQHLEFFFAQILKLTHRNVRHTRFSIQFQWGLEIECDAINRAIMDQTISVQLLFVNFSDT